MKSLTKSFALVTVGAVAGSAATAVLIARSLQDELPEIVGEKIRRGMYKGIHWTERKVFGEEVTTRVNRRYPYARYSSGYRSSK